MNKTVSVLIAAYNAEKYIEESVNSIRNQTYKDIEILICDDCSEDNTLSILRRLEKEDSRITVLCNPQNSFAAYSRNRCYQISRGDYIAIQDADDISSPDRIEALVRELESTDYDFVSCAEALFNKSADSPYRIVTHKQIPGKQDFLRGMCFCHAATLFKRECFESVGGYPVDDVIHRHEDYMLFMNLYAQGYRGFNLDEVLYYYRVDKDALGRRGWKSRIQECRIRYRGFKKMNLLPLGIPFVFVPVAGYIRQLIKKR